MGKSALGCQPWCCPSSLAPLLPARRGQGASGSATPLARQVWELPAGLLLPGMLGTARGAGDSPGCHGAVPVSSAPPPCTGTPACPWEPVVR